MEKYANKVRLLDYGLYSFYKKRNFINEKDRVEGRKEVTKIAKKIWELAAKKLVEKEGGVVLDKFGYVCHWMTPKKRVFKVPTLSGVKLMPNYHTNSYFYNTSILSNIFHYNYLRGWSMDKSFNLNINKGMFQQLKQGKKYKLYYSLVKRLYTDRFLDKLSK